MDIGISNNMHRTEDHHDGFQGKLWQVHKFGGTSVQNGKKEKVVERRKKERTKNRVAVE